MTDYDDLFDDVATSKSVFVDKGALNPLAESTEVVARDAEERNLATKTKNIKALLGWAISIG